MNNPSKTGIVYLVGAGPGDAGLITVRGAKLLEHCDVVVYDQLANSALLDSCPGAQKIYVGKKSSDHAMPQAQINQLLVDQARRGKRVVRLKGGDPFVFGRGGEECQTLAAAGIPFEIVPGITAAIAAAAYAGIPVTHRDLNTSFTVVTGHERDERGEASNVRWEVLAQLPCVAFYMGVAALPTICRKLIQHGMPPDMPAAAIHRGTTAAQKTIVSTLAKLPADAAGLQSPAITIIGQVVALREQLSWFEKRPLFGKTIVVTRTRQQASDLSKKLGELGAAVIESPTIELFAGDEKAVQAALAEAKNFDWIVFTSANGVVEARRALMAGGRDVRAFGGAKIAAIGLATAGAIERELCLRADLCPASFVAEALADELEKSGQVNGKRFLLLRAEIAREILPQRLKKAGAAEVRDVALYETRRAAALPEGLNVALAEKRVDWVTFTSASTAKNFIELLGADYGEKLNGVKLASIGPITTAALREAGLTPAVEAQTFTIPGLIDAILRNP